MVRGGRGRGARAYAGSRHLARRHFFKLLRPLASVPWLLQAGTVLLEPVSTGLTLTPASSYNYRTPDVSLASALDFAKGGIATQQHLWQATLNGSIVVFTTAPGPDFKDLTARLGADRGLAAEALREIARRALGDPRTRPERATAAAALLAPENAWALGTLGAALTGAALHTGFQSPYNCTSARRARRPASLSGRHARRTRV